MWKPSDGEDRKSTRLNSSHLVISYAVFCLKKKKNQAQRGIAGFNRDTIPQQVITSTRCGEANLQVRCHGTAVRPVHSPTHELCVCSIRVVSSTYTPILV